MQATTIEKHKRVQQSILAPLESSALRSFARMMPSWINSDHLTLLGFLGMVLAGLFYYLSQWHLWMLHLVNLAIVLNWFGDSLDGTLARFRGKLRPRYGYYVDHILDNFGVLFVIVGLGLSGLMSISVGLAFLATYFLMNINIYLATSSLGVFQISFGKLGPTELRLALMIGNLLLFRFASVSLFNDRFLLYDVGAVVAIAVMGVIVVLSTLKNTHTLYNLERF